MRLRASLVTVECNRRIPRASRSCAEFTHYRNQSLMLDFVA